MPVARWPRLRQLLCRLQGHEPALHMANGRLWLRCVLCGYESPGWSWLTTPPAITTARLLRFRKRWLA